MTNVILSVFFVLTIIYIVPFLIYGLASVVAGLKSPEGASPARFLVSVLISKIGTAIAFVLERTVDTLCFPMVADVRHG